MATEWNYPIAQILGCRNSLAEILIAEFEGRVLDGPLFERLAKVCHEGLPGEVDFPTVSESLRGLAGVAATRQTLHDTAHRLAGNLPRLRRHRPVPAWVVQPFKEWVPVQLMAVRRRATKFKPGADLTWKILAGTSAPLLVRQWRSVNHLRYLARWLGFTRQPRPRIGSRPSKYPYAVPEQLVTLRAYALIDPALCKAGEPGFEKVKFPPSVEAWNKEQLKYRFRVDKGYGCRHGQPASLPCHNCPVGYLTCRAGTHANDYESRHCPGCGNEEAPFDPDWPAGALCVNCERKKKGTG